MFTSLAPGLQPFRMNLDLTVQLAGVYFFYGDVFISYPVYQSLQVHHSSHGSYIIGLAKCHSQKDFRSLLLLRVCLCMWTLRIQTAINEL